MQLDLFRGVVPFVVVAEERSFRRAAVRLGISPAAVSKAIQVLEEALEVQLFQRNNRAVSLTRQGEVFFERCRSAVAAVQGAREALEGLLQEPRGELVLSVPHVLTQLLVPGLALLRARYPALSFTVRVTDQLSRLAEESVDVAVRVAPALEDSSLVARRLRHTRLVTVAAPTYLARRGVPRRLEELAVHDTLVLTSPKGKPWAWRFSSGPLSVSPVLQLDHAPTLVEAALAGLGLTQLLDFQAEPHLREGRLVQVLSEWGTAGPDIFAVCTQGNRASPNVRAAFNALADVFGSEPRP